MLAANRSIVYSLRERVISTRFFQLRSVRVILSIVLVIHSNWPRNLLLATIVIQTDNYIETVSRPRVITVNRGSSIPYRVT